MKYGQHASTIMQISVRTNLWSYTIFLAWKENWLGQKNILEKLEQLKVQKF